LISGGLMMAGNDTAEKRGLGIADAVVPGGAAYLLHQVCATPVAALVAVKR
jgi:hypothetical protein